MHAIRCPRTLHTGCNFFFKYSDRILFSTDLALELELYRLHFRFLETDDPYFEYPSPASRQGKVEYLQSFFADEVLRRVYRNNARQRVKKFT